MATPVTPLRKIKTQDATLDDKLTYQSVGKSGTLIKVTLIKLSGIESPVRLEVTTQSRIQRFVNWFVRKDFWVTRLNDVSGTITNPKYIESSKVREQILNRFNASDADQIKKDFSTLIGRSGKVKKGEDAAARVLGMTGSNIEQQAGKSQSEASSDVATQSEKPATPFPNDDVEKTFGEISEQSTYVEQPNPVVIPTWNTWIPWRKVDLTPITTETHFLSFPDNCKVELHHYGDGYKYMDITFDENTRPLIIDQTTNTAVELGLTEVKENRYDPSQPSYTSSLLKRHYNNSCEIEIDYRNLDTIKRIRIGNIPLARILLGCFKMGYHVADEEVSFTVRERRLHEFDREECYSGSKYNYDLDYDTDYENTIKAKLRALLNTPNM